MCPSVPFRSELKCTAGNDATDRFFQQIEPFWYDLRGKEAVWSPSLWEVLQKSTGRAIRDQVNPLPLLLPPTGKRIFHIPSQIMIPVRMLLLALMVVALSVPSHAQVRQFIHVNMTLDYSPVPQGSASIFLGQSSGVAAYEALTRGRFEAGIAAKPNLNPLLTSPPVLSSLKVVGAVDVPSSSGSSLVVTFQTVMRVVSASGLSDDNLQSLKWAPYWYSEGLLSHDYMSDLAEQLPRTFGSLSSFGISVGVTQSLVPGPSPPAPVSPTRAPVRRPTWSPVLPTAMPRPVAPPSGSPV